MGSMLKFIPVKLFFPYDCILFGFSSRIKGPSPKTSHIQELCHVVDQRGPLKCQMYRLL